MARAGAHAVQAGHVHVEEHHVGRLGFVQPHILAAVAGLADLDEALHADAVAVVHRVEAMAHGVLLQRQQRQPGVERPFLEPAALQLEGQPLGTPALLARPHLHSRHPRHPRDRQAEARGREGGDEEAADAVCLRGHGYDVAAHGHEVHPQRDQQGGQRQRQQRRQPARPAEGQPKASRSGRLSRRSSRRATS